MPWPGSRPDFAFAWPLSLFIILMQWFEDCDLRTGNKYVNPLILTTIYLHTHTYINISVSNLFDSIYTCNYSLKSFSWVISYKARVLGKCQRKETPTDLRTSDFTWERWCDGWCELKWEVTNHADKNNSSCHIINKWIRLRPGRKMKTN